MAFDRVLRGHQNWQAIAEVEIFFRVGEMIIESLRDHIDSRRSQLGEEPLGIADAGDCVHTLPGEIAQWSYAPLDETGRAVERIRALLDLRAAASDMQGQGP